MKKLTVEQKKVLVGLMDELANTKIMEHLYGKEWLDSIKRDYKHLTPEARLRRLLKK